MKQCILLLGFLFSMQISAQIEQSFDVDDDDLKIGGDIFSDFNEDLENQQIMEDERFYRYGRLYSLTIALGYTTFDGNRGSLYEDELPSYSFSLNFFNDFRNCFGLGLAYSSHHFILTEPVHAYNSDGKAAGLVEVGMLRVFFHYRYYIDTANLGTAITYANPYFTGRLEYWYVTNKFIDQPTIDKDNGGGLGFGIGGGLEFPIQMRESYISLEFLIHSVHFHDKYTQAYRPWANSTTGYGWDDLTGFGYSTMIGYVISW